MTVRFGIIGTGFICDRFATALSAATGAKLHSVLSRKLSSAEAFATKHATSRQHCHESLEEFLADRYMDAVYIGVPTGLHASYADAAAAAGKHVFLEKPMALSTPDAAKVQSACEQAGRTLGLGYQNRFHPLHEKARDWLEAGHIGEVVFARTRWFVRSGHDPTPWRRTRELAGWWALGDLGTHCIDLLRYMLGEVTQVTAVIHPPTDPAIETEDTAVLFLRHSGGIPSIVECSTVTPSPGTLLEIFGSEGYVRAEGTLGMDGEGTLFKSEKGGKEMEFTEWQRPADLFVREIEEFLLAIREGRPPRASGTDGYKGVEILEAAMDSAAEGGKTVSMLETSG